MPKKVKSISDVEHDMIMASSAIGSIHECNSSYTDGLARIIWELGKPVESLTVAELMLLHKQHRDVYNKIHREVA